MTSTDPVMESVVVNEEHLGAEAVSAVRLGRASSLFTGEEGAGEPRWKKRLRVSCDMHERATGQRQFKQGFRRDQQRGATCNVIALTSRGERGRDGAETEGGPATLSAFRLSAAGTPLPSGQEEKADRKGMPDESKLSGATSPARARTSTERAVVGGEVERRRGERGEAARGRPTAALSPIVKEVASLDTFEGSSETHFSLRSRDRGPQPPHHVVAFRESTLWFSFSLGAVCDQLLEPPTHSDLASCLAMTTDNCKILSLIHDVDVASIRRPSSRMPRATGSGGVMEECAWRSARRVGTGSSFALDFAQILCLIL
eukprot:scaffold27386_cov28-Tisochrysis_lutea.AAC.3